MLSLLVWALLPSVLASEPRIQVEVIPDGHSEEELQVLTQLALNEKSIQRRLQVARHRLISSQETSDQKLKLHIYDYDRNELITVTKDFKEVSQAPEIRSSFEQLPPSEEEFDEAVEFLKKDATFGKALVEGRISAAQAMPGVIQQDTLFSKGAHARILTVSLVPTKPDDQDFPREIVGVNLSEMKLVRYEKKAPPTAMVDMPDCGWPNAYQANTRRGTAGSSTVIIRDGTEVLWEMRVIRPSASSGYWGSGIDLRNITYKGKKILTQLNVPILNVNYLNNVCGPYRDWQYAENPFNAVGTDRAAGVRIASSKPTTILDDGVDRGNFRGVAIYTEGTETVMVSELSAAWYRYISTYRFLADGTIKPEFGFSAVDNTCVCRTHFHHVFWRMDFDLGTATNNSMDVMKQGVWTAVEREQVAKRGNSAQKWRVFDHDTRQAFEIIPGEHDGTANTYGKGDAWILRYRSGQLDDSRVYQGTSNNLNAFVTGEDVRGADVVFWYGGHFTHEVNDHSAVHVVGPTIRPVTLD